jgi:hypothetical protein
VSHEYDVFEKFADGSSLWRGCVVGRETAELHLLHLAQRSQNRFYAINVVSGKTIFPELRPDGFTLPQKVGRGSKVAVA